LLAFRSFFAILFQGALSDPVLTDLGIARREPAKAAAPPPPLEHASDGALQMLSILQRDSRLIDFIMEDIAPYSDDQVGAAVRTLHDQCRESLTRYLKLEPVIDGVEGTFSRAPSRDPGVVKFIGNVPAKPPEGGTLRHKGWRAANISLPKLNPREDHSVVAPAEIEIE
jgi:hypothetical protein